MAEEKKKSTKKSVKKETPKKKAAPKKKVEEVKPVEVKEVIREKDLPTVPEEEPFGIRFKRFISSYKFLYTAFAVLLVLVLILAVMVYTKSREDQKTNSNIVFSIMQEGTRNSLNMDLNSLVGKEYSLKVTNYRANNINSKEIPYSIHIKNDTDVEIEVIKNHKGENLITDQHDTTIEGDPLAADEKEEVIYYFKVTNSDKIKTGDSIQIEVVS